MLSLDVPTMLLMTAAASATMAGSLAAMRPQRREGMGLWALALVLHTITYVLYTLRGVAPNWASVVLANTLLAGTFALVLAAVHQFQGRALPWLRMGLPVLVMAALFIRFMDDYRTCVIVAGVVPPLQLAMVLWSLWHPQRPASLRGAALLAAGLGLQAMLLAVRGALVAVHGIPARGLLQAEGLQSLTFIAAFVVVILASLGFILMAKDRADAENRYFASHDGLTGLFNRRVLLLAARRDVAQAVRMHQPYSLMMMDIDHFKAVNDGHGHLGGDSALCHVADLLRTRLRAQDMVGRYGGEEFLVLLPGTALHDAVVLAEVLRNAVEQSPATHEGQPIAVTLSIGVCGGRPQHVDAWDTLIRRADQALYTAKRAGRNRVECIALAQDLSTPLVTAVQ
ncbi:MAG: GGDEF domain-containing protein [Proteobacteria bacterium]|nr:GGDEF domain-containing protein [Pseudomonadota bacterium]